jgi:PAS domain S-box-containing protein
MSSSLKLADALSKINDGICVFGSDRKPTFVNEKASQLLETADDEFQAKIKLASTDGSGRRFEHFHAGLNRWFEHQSYPHSDGGLTIISRDTTSRHRIEAALRANEERFRRIIDSNIIGVIVVEAGIITEANDGFLKMVGHTRREQVTRQLHWREMTPRDYDAADAKAQIELKTAGVFSPYEKEFFRKDGSRVPILISGVSIEARPNTPETLCLAMDLSERRRAEERVRLIVECSKILASSLECDKTFPEVAEFVVSKIADTCSIFVREDHELTRVASASRTPAGQSIHTDAELENVMATGRTYAVVSPVSCIVSPIVARNQVCGVLAVASDKPSAFDEEYLHLFEELGRRAGLALENARMYRETQRANRLKDEFVAVISHELRTPLTPILGGVYMMRTDPYDSAVVARALDLIERSAKTQVKIVDDLLDVSRALSGKLRLNMELVDLSVVIQAAVDTVRPASQAKGIEIGVRLRGLSGVLAGDADRLQQVFWNLLANAVKFTPKQGRIAVELLEKDGHAEVHVIDSGMGIEADFLPHVFEKFRQADTSRTRLHGGLGLGLAIVRHLVESHGGTVHASSSGDEQGSTFVVRLPLRPLARAAKISGTET